MTTVLEQFFQQRPPHKCVNGEVILFPDKWFEAVYMVKSGYFKIYAIGNRGVKHVHVIYSAGDIFPLVWVFTGKTKKIYYESMGESYVYRASMEDFKDFVRQNGDASHAAFMRLVDQFSTYTDRIENLERADAYERVAHCLLLFGERFGHQTEKGFELAPVFNHSVIAESINLARETVSRAVEKLEVAGIVAYGPKRKLLVLDKEALETESGRN